MDPHLVDANTRLSAALMLVEGCNPCDDNVGDEIHTAACALRQALKAVRQQL